MVSRKTNYTFYGKKNLKEDGRDSAPLNAKQTKETTCPVKMQRECLWQKNMLKNS